MPRRRNTHPTDGELEILQVLWEQGELPLGRIRAGLREKREVAATTVATMLGVMREKKLARRRKGSEGYLWSAAVTRGEAAEGMVGKLIDRVFEGSAGRLVAHMMEAGRLSDDDVAEIRELLSADAAKKPRRKPRRKRS
jgi:BlaI family penicillinase repressor